MKYTIILLQNAVLSHYKFQTLCLFQTKKVTKTKYTRPPINRGFSLEKIEALFFCLTVLNFIFSLIQYNNVYFNQEGSIKFLIPKKNILKKKQLN